MGLANPAKEGPHMLVVTSIYFANLKPVREPATGRIVERKVSDLTEVEREIVSMHQGSNRVEPLENS
jgi:hypothetical protein